MAKATSPKTISGDMDARGMKTAIVVSRYNSFVTKELLGGALDVLERHGANPGDQTVLWVPGGFEISLGVKAALEKGGFDGVIALGCVMTGETSHNEHIVAEVAKAVSGLGLQYGVPVGFGVLSPNTTEQAIARAGLKMGNKGAEAALAVVEMIQMLRALRG